MGRRLGCMAVVDRLGQLGATTRKNSHVGFSLVKLIRY